MATTLASISIKDSSSWNTYLDLIYPIGSYYLSNSSTSPGSRFGGTWSQIKDQRFLCGYTSVTTGGANSVTLTIDQMPSHSHQWKGWNWFQTNLNSGDKALIAGTEVAGSTSAVGGGAIPRKPTLVPHLFYVVQDCVTTLPLLEVI